MGTNSIPVTNGISADAFARTAEEERRTAEDYEDMARKAADQGRNEDAEELRRLARLAWQQAKKAEELAATTNT